MPGFLIPQWIPAARNPSGAVTPRRGDAVVIFLPMIERIYIDLCRMLKKVVQQGRRQIETGSVPSGVR